MLTFPAVTILRLSELIVTSLIHPGCPLKISLGVLSPIMSHKTSRPS